MLLSLFRERAGYEKSFDNAKESPYGLYIFPISRCIVCFHQHTALTSNIGRRRSFNKTCIGKGSIYITQNEVLHTEFAKLTLEDRQLICHTFPSRDRECFNS